MPRKLYQQNNKDLVLPSGMKIEAGDLKGVELVRPVLHPEAYLRRKQSVQDAQAGTYPKSDCPHRMEAIGMAVDDLEPDRKINLFNCDICGSILFLVDPYGRAASDGN